MKKEKNKPYSLLATWALITLFFVVPENIQNDFAYLFAVSIFFASFLAFIRMEKYSGVAVITLIFSFLIFMEKSNLINFLN